MNPKNADYAGDQPQDVGPAQDETLEAGHGGALAVTPSDQNPGRLDPDGSPICEGCGQPILDEPAEPPVTRRLALVAHAACRVGLWALICGILEF
jgi:hypothetical protein